MQYIVVPDRSKNHDVANYTDANGKYFFITPTEATNPVVSGNAQIVSDLTGYTLLPAIAAEKAAILEQVKLKALTQLNSALEAKLAAGIAIPLTGMAAASIVIPASQDWQLAFTSATSLINTAESMSGDSTTFNEMPVSKIFGRPVLDAQNNPYDMTVAQYKQLVIFYAYEIGVTQGETKAIVNQVLAASTTQEVESILAANSIR